jgi:hypothetical protein
LLRFSRDVDNFCEVSEINDERFLWLAGVAGLEDVLAPARPLVVRATEEGGMEVVGDEMAEGC